MTDDAPALLRELVDVQREVLAELRALRMVMEARGARQHVDQAAGELVRRIAQLPRVPFSVAELLEHAQVVPDLAAAIVAAVGALNGRKLGKLMKRIEGTTFDHASIVRCGTSREGALWTCGFREFQTRKLVAAR